MQSEITFRVFSVAWYLAIAEGTAGFSPMSTADAVIRDNAEVAYVCPATLARASSIPSKRPMGRLNCLRMREYAPVESAHSFDPPAEVEGKVMARPTASSSISIRQPSPALSTPPTSVSSGTNTSLPRIGPLLKGTFKGMWRLPISIPGVSRGISARLIPRSCLSPTRLSGSYSLNASPTMVATGASVI